MALCEILYKGDLGDIRRALKRYLNNKNETIFLNTFIKGDLPKLTRYTKTTLDALDTLLASIISFDLALDLVIQALISKNPSDEPALKNLQLIVHNKLHIDLDESLVGTVEELDSQVEAKTETEIRDLNSSNLEEHLKEIYGVGAYNIIRGLRETFDDVTTAAGYWDINTGLAAIKSDIILNKNFQAVKNKFYSIIVKYLKSKYPTECANLKEYITDSEGNFIGSEYFNTINRFYTHIKLLDTFNSELELDLKSKNNRVLNKRKEELYRTMMKVLDAIPEFHKAAAEKYNNAKLTNMLDLLYSADHFSEYYNTTKLLIQDLNLENTNVGNLTILDILNDIESDEVTLLNATNSYTSLTHFDELLLELHGKAFSITPGMEGLEMGDSSKYQYHLDTAHERKSWQQSELIDSEKYIANLSRRVLNQVRVFDYKTGLFKNRRADSATFIMAARNLINDILYNNISWVRIPNDPESSIRLNLDKFIANIVTNHTNPIERFLVSLELLFDKNLYSHIGSKKRLSDYDLDMLYSIYNSVYNLNNPNSLIYLELINFNKNIGTSQNLLLTISGFIDRNTVIDYLEVSYDSETHIVLPKIKRKFFNNPEVYKLKNRINSGVNSIPAEEAKTLRDKYQFLANPAVNGKTYYSVTVGGENFVLRTPDIGGRILSNNNVSFEDSSIFLRINDIDLLDFKNKILYNGTLNEDEALLKAMLLFIDDHLYLNILKNPELGLDILQVYKDIYQPKEGKVVGKYYMMPLMQLAMRSAYANSRYADADGTPLKLYFEALGTEDDGIYQGFINNSKKSKLFSLMFNNVKFNIASFNDEVIDTWVDALSILKGDAVKSTTKDREGNPIPNNGVNKLGSNLPHYLNKLEGTNTGCLLFVLDNLLIRSTIHDLEVTTWNDDVKAVKRFTASELFYHAIFNKFWGNYINTGNVIILPTDFSDKTTFINYEISTLLDGDILRDSRYDDKIKLLYLDTIGQMYKNVWQSTVAKLLTVANLYNTENGTNLGYAQIMRSLSEKELINLASRAGVNLMKDKDYRVIEHNGNEATAVNEELKYNATVLYNNVESLNRALEREKINFIGHLIANNSSFLVIDYGDSISNYIKDKISEKASSNNPIILTILKYFEGDVEGRKRFFSNWVDEKTGKLIIAKLGKTNILGVEGKFDNKSVILNPFLDKFFYLEGLYSNNLRMSLTGSEINHPDKAKKTLYKAAKKAKSFVDFQKLGIKVSNPGVADELVNILARTDYVGDILAELDRIALGIRDVLSPDEEELVTALQLIEEESILTISNVALGTQFKRNVIIPATLLYCQLNTKDGIPPKVKCAVIYDEPASVWNYRGDHEKDIDSADGSAQITPFLSILENKSLDALAVGFIKKPIWHSYDTESGTAFLAKFATDTITNEAMRTSFNSHTNLFKLFKKMTNLSWNGNVSLTLSILYGEIGGDISKIANLTKWFLVSILGNAVVLNNEGFDLPIKENRLIYENKYGDKIEIVGFGKTTDGIYYTKEIPFVKTTLDRVSPTEVYHVFDENSNHITFDDPKKASDYIVKGGHTIDSLFELHTALGGINCMNSSGEYSEFVNEVVVNFMNNVGYLNSGYSEDDIVDLESYTQPLKLYHIGYALNNTAVKNGALNINPETSWHDDTPLHYFEVDSDGLGMLMNADHDIIDSELTEFSQVITATSAYGFTHDQCNEIFYGLALSAVLSSKKTLDAINKFLETNFDNILEAQSDLYDAIGRIILVNLSIKDRESLQGIIMDAVTKVFYKSKNHSQDSAKIPFSDPNVYSDFIATLASTINKESIKRKHPGSGCVMVPAHNMIQYFELDGLKYMSLDLLKKAREDYKLELQQILSTHLLYDAVNNTIVNGEETYYLNNQPIKYLEGLISQLGLENTSRYNLETTDVNLYNNNLIQRFLEKKQASAPIFSDRSWFMPTDIVDVLDETGKYLTTIDLDSMDKYYKFKDGFYELMYNPDGLKKLLYRVNVTKPHNLRPSLIRWKYKHELNLEDLQIAKSEVYDKFWRNDPTKSNKAFTLSLNEDPDRKFEIVKDIEDNYWSIHFKTIRDDETWETAPKLTEEQKERLFSAAASLIPVGDYLSTYGELSLGGISGLNRFSKYGFTKVGERDVVMKVTGEATKIPIWLNTGKYMNIFDSPVIKNAYFGLKFPNYREQILDILHNLHNGIFTDVNGNSRQILEGSLENSPAELVMSNLYKEKFGIENESLSEILEKGEDYFRKKYNKLNAPANTIYDIAFLRDTGNHTLITLGEVPANEYIREKEFDNGQLSTNDKDEIVLMKGNKEVFEIGKWIDYSDKVTYSNGLFIDTLTLKPVLKLEYYRLKDKDNPNSVLKRIDYITRYEVTDKVIKKGKTLYKTNILYKLANIKNFEEALGNNNDAKKLRASIINKIYLNDSYKLALINTNKLWKEEKLNQVRSAFSFIQSNFYVSLEVKDLISAQLSSIDVTDISYKSLKDPEEEKARKELIAVSKKLNKTRYKELLDKFLLNEAHKKWVSFLDSLNYIASRIPAQTLLSFMAMKNIAWTLNSKNIAYVSWFLTYLQGSDLRISIVGY